jgi:hypothetical protein
MDHTTTYRGLTTAETTLLRRRRGLGLERWVETLVIMPVMTGGGVFVLGLFVLALIFWLLEKIGWVVRGGTFFGAGMAVLSVLALVIAIASAVNMRRLTKRERVDEQEANVEVISVREARLVCQEERNDEGPLYYFGIGAGKLLFLGGQWLEIEPSVYGIDPETESDDWCVFPTSSFVVHRLPASGRVLRIETTGDRLTVEGELSRTASMPSWLRQQMRQAFMQESLVIAGDFEELLHATRSPSRSGVTAAQP